MLTTSKKPPGLEASRIIKHATFHHLPKFSDTLKRNLRVLKALQALKERKNHLPHHQTNKAPRLLPYRPEPYLLFVGLKVDK